jgi:hypothetical protein
MTRMHETREQAAEKPHILHCASPDSLQRTEAYASARRASRALSLKLFEQSAFRNRNDFNWTWFRGHEVKGQ